jgi:hypothetical protein
MYAWLGCQIDAEIAALRGRIAELQAAKKKGARAK